MKFLAKVLSLREKIVVNQSLCVCWKSRYFYGRIFLISFFLPSAWKAKGCLIFSSLGHLSLALFSFKIPPLSICSTASKFLVSLFFVFKWTWKKFKVFKKYKIFKKFKSSKTLKNSSIAEKFQIFKIVYFLSDSYYFINHLLRFTWVAEGIWKTSVLLVAILLAFWIKLWSPNWQL